MSAEQNNISNDLDKLLDNALEDFGKNDSGTAKSNTSNAKTAPAGESSLGAAGLLDSDELFLEQAKLLAERMNTLFSGADESNDNTLPPLPQDPDKIMTAFKKMAEAAALTLKGESSASAEEVAKHSDAITQALKSLEEGTDNLTTPATDDNLANLFNSLNFENAVGDDVNTFWPFMEGMMQSLLSAEVLLPTVKEVVEKYHVYLAESADKISAEDKERYEKQLQLFKTIEGHLERETPNCSAKEKREIFRLVMEDMRKLQDYGQPPEVVAQAAGDMPGREAAAGFGDPQCPMM